MVLASDRNTYTQFNDELPYNAQYEAGIVAVWLSGPNTNGSQFYLQLNRQAGMLIQLHCVW